MLKNILSLEMCFYRAQKYRQQGHLKRANLLSLFYNYLHSCDIPPSTQIGEGIYFAHRGIGVVINKKTIIGSNCSIYHGVTIGGRGGEHANDIPIIGNNVWIGCHASILGGEIGDNAVIGAHSLVLDDVPCGATVVGCPAKIVKKVE